MSCMTADARDRHGTGLLVFIQSQVYLDFFKQKILEIYSLVL